MDFVKLIKFQGFAIFSGQEALNLNQPMIPMFTCHIVAIVGISLNSVDNHLQLPCPKQGF